MYGPWITDLEINTVMDAMNNWYEKAYYYVEKFQDEFSKYHDRKYGVMTNSCTTSIHLLLRALDIKQGDEVIIPDMTWIASAAPISYVGAKPILADVNPENWCLDPESVEKRITKKTKAIIVVDLYGNMPNMDYLSEIAEKHNIHLIEDSAEALGSKYKETKAGKFGVGSVFSFHRTKTLTTGEGGMLILDDEKLYDRAMKLRDHGKSKTKMYYNDEIGYKYVPSNIQAALGYAQLQRLNELINKKREILRMYKEKLSDIKDLQFNLENSDVFNGAWTTAVVFGKSHKMTKEEFIERMNKLGLLARPFFYPLSSLPAYPKYNKKGKKLNPFSYDISSRGVDLSSALNIKEKEIDEICDGIKKILKK